MSVPIFAQIVTPIYVGGTPEAEAITKYGDIPVSLYTGKIDLNIPLYTLKCGDIEIPISIQYYSGGIKVEDYSTGVGTGWNLKAGGAITRTVIGSNQYTSSGNIALNYLPISGYPDEDDYDKLVNLSLLKSTIPDKYFYNFNEFSGSFHIKNNSAVFRNSTELKCEFPVNASNQKEIIITDGVGRKYYFIGHLNDFNLYKILSPNKMDSICLEYTSDQYLYYELPKNPVYYTLYPGVTKVSVPENGPVLKYVGKRVSKIYTSNNDSVIFVEKQINYGAVGHSREALEEMKVYNKKEELLSIKFKTNDIKTIKPYTTKIGMYPNPSSVPEINYRLYLDGIEFYDKKNNKKYSYAFDYYGRTNDGKDSLPNRYSTAQDFGGLYNGADTNTSLIPAFNQIIDLGIEVFPVGNMCCKYDYVSNVNIPGANRIPNINFGQLGSLRTITYPTGGKTELSYAQMFDYNNEASPGLLISKILNTDNVDDTVKSIIYDYLFPTHASPPPPFWAYSFRDSRTSEINPCPPCECINSLCDDYEKWHRVIELSPGPLHDLGLNDGPMIGYGRVIEKTLNKGKTLYEYTTFGSNYDDSGCGVEGIWYASGAHQVLHETFPSINHWPLGPLPNNGWKLGHLLSKKCYDESNNLIYQVDNDYSFIVLDTIPAIKLLDRSYTFFYYQYNYLSTWVRMNQITESADGVTTDTYFSYDSKFHKQLTRKKIISSDDKTLQEKYMYPPDVNVPNSVYDKMYSNNIITPVIECTKLVNENIVSATLNTYKENNEGFVPDKIFKIEIQTPIDSIDFKHFTASSMDTHYSTAEITFVDYNKSNNPTMIRSKDGITTAYIWDSTGAFPVARIVSGASFTVSSTVQTNIKNLSFKGTDIKTDVDSDIYDLSTQLASFLNNKNYRVTLYTYAPLVGMTSQTDPNGVTTYYEYDDFGRLKNAKNDDNAKLQEYNYHYRGN